MFMGDDRSNISPSFEEGSPCDEDGDLGGQFSIDMGTLLDILGKDPDSYERRLEDSSSNDVPQGFFSSAVDLSGSSAFSPGYNVGPSDSRTLISFGSSKYADKFVVSSDSKLESTLQLASPVHSSSGSLTEWMSVPGHGHFFLDKDIVSKNASSIILQDNKEMIHEMPNNSETFSFPAGCSDNRVAGNTESSDIEHQNHDFRMQLTRWDPEFSSEKLLRNDDKLNALIAPNAKRYSRMEIGLSHDRLVGYGNQQSNLPYVIDLLDPPYSSASKQFSNSFDMNSLPDDGNEITSINNEKLEHFTMGTRLNSIGANRVETLDDGLWGMHVGEDFAAEELSDPNWVRSYASSSDTAMPFNPNDDLRIKQESRVNANIPNWLTTSHDVAPLHGNDVMGVNSSSNSAGVAQGEESWKPSLSGFLTSNSCDKGELAMKEMHPESKRPRLSLGDYDGISGIPTAVAQDQYLDVWDVNASGVPVSNTINQQFIYTNLGETKSSLPMFNGSYISNISGQKIQSNSLVQSFDDGDDSDLCILEDISAPAQLNISPFTGKFPVAARHMAIPSSLNSAGVGHAKLKGNGGRSVFQAPLQDFCQTKSEDTPPEGFMAVPLLRHQRIALSWMVWKENAVSCSGGILADDQGLGKTVSTIALILKERPPSSVESSKQSEPETLNLDDDDDDGMADDVKLKKDADSCSVNESVCGRKSTSVRAKRRPAAGTLIVCPTSVLRQWSEELQNKVTSKANLSVLVYHGSNRTKDPYELARYDIVLTTYAIVTMEVPKKPLVDDDDYDTKGNCVSPVKLSSFKKRKYPPNSSKKSSKGKKSVDVDVLHIRPLAGVAWFRVVLDEAQSIKNHRTQVARACWGLRAKRRWCLSGTPMQNAIDDLYSYFRFLKHESLSVYKSFCSEIKVPILRSPTNGYRKLQAVLGTIMLRRTKATLLDGEPIINLPPKTIKLLKVEFTPEERKFYTTLETDSRAQFAEYAAAGTVQKNYVNILLMLLRLRQACDHRLLVKGFSSGLKSLSSVEMAKKIPRERQLHLLRRFKASLAICNICRDPPEDAVVTSCGHVFCNQCICEHLSSDDTHCSATSCKNQLKGMDVFSVVALRCALFDQPTPESTSDCSQPKLEETSDAPFSPVCSYDSSKIKAALELLQSLNKRKDFTKMCPPNSVEEGTPGKESASSLNSSGLRESVCKEENKGKNESPGVTDKVTAEKAIVFSQWTRMLDLLEDCLKNSSIQYRRLDGTMSIVARDKAVKDFNTLPEVSVMIMSLKAASLGLNMVAACHVLLLDLWWNPTTEDQAIDRAHRIGQTRPVTVLRLTVKDTVEDRILALQQKKREMVAAAFGGDDPGTRDARLSVGDLNYLFSMGR